MTTNATRWTWAAGVVFASLCGCGQEVGTPPATEQAKPAETSTVNEKLSADPRFGQTFAEATRAEPPADWPRPPDVTMTGKSVGKLYTEITRLWSLLPLTDAAGKPIPYIALLDTELGEIEITLRADLAPNHVRNFLALVKVGYYDGLVFERTVRQKGDNQADLELIEAGCPTGTGDVGGSLGYWLKPEFSDEPHVEGTVAACHAEEDDTACCKFFVTLTKAPFLDKHYTIFGKVTRGLDVAKKIFSLPVRNDPSFPEGDRPEKPVVIRKVTIQAASGENRVALRPNP